MSKLLKDSYKISRLIKKEMERELRVLRKPEKQRQRTKITDIVLREVNYFRMLMHKHERRGGKRYKRNKLVHFSGI